MASSLRESLLAEREELPDLGDYARELALTPPSARRPRRPPGYAPSALAHARPSPLASLCARCGCIFAQPALPPALGGDGARPAVMPQRRPHRRHTMEAANPGGSQSDGRAGCGGDADRDWDRQSHSRVRVAPENRRGWGGEYGRLERLDMDPINHPYNVDKQRNPCEVANDYRQMVITSKDDYAWVLTLVIGFLVALLARFVQLGISTLVELRNSHVQSLIESTVPQDALGEGTLGFAFSKPFIFFTVWNACFAAAAGVYILKTSLYTVFM